MPKRAHRALPPRLLSRAQVADYLQCSKSTVDNLVADGFIPSPQAWRDLKRWDRIALDRVIDRVYGLNEDTADQFSIDEAINGRDSARKVRRDPPKQGRV